MIWQSNLTVSWRGMKLSLTLYKAQFQMGQGPQYKFRYPESVRGKGREHFSTYRHKS